VTECEAACICECNAVGCIAFDWRAENNECRMYNSVTGQANVPCDYQQHYWIRVSDIPPSPPSLSPPPELTTKTISSGWEWSALAELRTADVECTDVGGYLNLGEFDSVNDCAVAAAANGCTTIMYSHTYEVWGCRCCADPDPGTPHELWDVYDVVTPDSDAYLEPTIGTAGAVQSATFDTSGCHTGSSCLKLTQAAPISADTTGSATAHLAYIASLTPGDTVTMSFWGKGGGTTTTRIWSHFSANDHTQYDSTAGGAESFVGADGVWGLSEYTVVVPDGKDAIVVEAAVYATDASYPSIWIDDLTVTVTSGSGQVATAPAYSSDFSVSGSVLGTSSGSADTDNLVVEQVNEGCYSYGGCFQATEEPLEGTPKILLAAVYNLQQHDHVYGQIWLQGAGSNTKARIRGRYFDQDITNTDGGADGPDEWKGMDHLWGLSSYVWPIPEGKTGLLIEVRMSVQDIAYNSLLIDNMLVSTNSTSAYVVMSPISDTPPAPPASIDITTDFAQLVKGVAVAKFVKGLFTPPCTDEHESCHYWAYTAEPSECLNHPDYMNEYCQLSCRLCCEDQHEDCATWARSGECENNPDYMLYQCPVSCDNCGIDHPPLPPSPPYVPPGGCMDEHPDCAYWANLEPSECTLSEEWMNENCPLSCDTCESRIKKLVKTVAKAAVAASVISRFASPGNGDGTVGGGCADSHESCYYWATLSPSECVVNPDYMLDNCELSCRVCCEDQHSMCSTWAGSGECDANPYYMHAECPVSCDVCDDRQHPPFPPSPPAVPPGGCTDFHISCSSWASAGECEINPDYMLVNCELSCGICEDSTITDGDYTCTSEDAVGHRCGPDYDFAVCNEGRCCSQHEWCGDSADYCNDNSLVQYSDGYCMPPPDSCPSEADVGHRCGPEHGDASCGEGRCCSEHEWCGSSSDHCNANAYVEYSDGNCPYDRRRRLSTMADFTYLIIQSNETQATAGATQTNTSAIRAAFNALHQLG